MFKSFLTATFLLIGSVPINAQNILIRADRLFDGTELRTNHIMVISDQTIIYVGKPAGAKMDIESVIDLGDATLMPGMIEGHSHVLLYPYNETNWNDQVLKESRSLRAIRGAQMAERNLMAGFTTIRDLGSEGAEYADVGIKKSIELGINPGPRMIVAGKAIVATGSYGPKGFHPDIEVHLGAEAADGDDLIRVVRDQIGKGADVIKVYADYRWGPKGESLPTFSLDELSLIVKTAASSGRQTVAHANSDEAIRRAVLAGVSTIEHGSEVSRETLLLMKEKGVALCPTLAATDAITQYRGWNKEEDPEPAVITQKRAMMKIALEIGVTIAAGGDVGVFPHGENYRELDLMVAYGMKPIDVLRSVTSVNAEVFRLERLGMLKAGYLADVIAVKGDPTEEILQTKEILFVMKDGVIYQ
ncbi:MAG: imidazolonepropionase-like amidohydrolase [Cyclobacteriaceae bacterium]|jgi:imidazolonepropionase-like amidohydrolase